MKEKNRRECNKCSRINSECIKYPCNTWYCLQCIYEDTLSKLEQMKYYLDDDPTFYHNKSSYLSCLGKCEECKLSLSLETISHFVEILDLDDLEKENFRSLSELGRTFFSGLPTIFSKCLKCQSLSSAVGCYPLFCKPCVKELVKIQTFQDLDDIIYISNPEPVDAYPAIIESQEISKDLHLISYRDGPRFNYNFENVRENNRNYKRVFKVRHLEHNQNFIIARFHHSIDTSGNFVRIGIPEDQDMQILLVLSAIFN